MLKDIKDKTPNAETIKLLESLLEAARAGELRTIVAVVGYDDDAWSHCWSIDNRSSRRRLVGEATMLHFDIVTKQAFEDGDTVLASVFD